MFLTYWMSNLFVEIRSRCCLKDKPIKIAIVLSLPPKHFNVLSMKHIVETLFRYGIKGNALKRFRKVVHKLDVELMLRTVVQVLSTGSTFKIILKCVSQFGFRAYVLKRFPSIVWRVSIKTGFDRFLPYLTPHYEGTPHTDCSRYCLKNQLKQTITVYPGGPKRVNPKMTTSTATARRKGDPEH